MIFRNLTGFAAIVGAILVVSGCDGAANREPSSRNAAIPADRPFSADDRRAARALSLGSFISTATSDDPNDHAVVCAASLDALAEKLAASPGFPAEQMAVIRQARRIYEDRADSRYPARGSGRQSIKEAEARYAATVESFAQHGQVALGCLRDLA